MDDDVRGFLTILALIALAAWDPWGRGSLARAIRDTRGWVGKPKKPFDSLDE